MVQNLSNYIKGLHAENKACDFLIKNNFIVLQKRLQTPYGEIDILAKDKDILVAIEVKYRKNIVLAKNSILTNQKKRIENAMLWLMSKVEFLIKYNLKANQLQRLDVIVVGMNNKIEHYKNAWISLN